VNVRENKFFGNSVESPLASWRYSDAGALYFACAPHIARGECQVILDSNRFGGNTAKNKGGALRYVNTNFTTVYEEVKTGRRLQSSGSPGGNVRDTNVYRNNKAAYANDIASYPASYQYSISQNGFDYSSKKGEEIVFAPGQDLVLTVELYDREGRLFNDEQDASCSLVFDKKDSLKQGTTILNADSVSVNGTITFSQLNIRQEPNTTSDMRVIFSSLELFGNDIETLQSPAPFKVIARPCNKGESYGLALTCLPCEPGYKLYEVQTRPGECQPCLVTEQCYGANRTSPRPEYWRSSPESQNYLRCFNPEACLGGTIEDPLGRCA